MSPDDKQRALLPDQDRATPLFTADASLQAAISAFEGHMQSQGFALNTVKAFLSDLRLLAKYLGAGQPIGEIGTKNLNAFLDWMLHERGVPCSPKTYSRRVTTLKVFFSWLQENGVLDSNPAAAVIQLSVTSPLPHVPTPSEIEAALRVTEAIRQGENRKPDARPHLTLTLVLDTAIKKGEAMSIVPNHIDRDNPDQPMLHIRYANPRMRYKERKVPLNPEWLAVLREYLEQYNPPDTLFTCTARNLEYILSDVAEAAGLEKGLLSFENLRWASALRDLQNKVEPDDIRQKLGLSKITWRETKKKLDKLAEMQSEQA